MKEECWILHGVHIGRLFTGILRYHSKGTTSSVDFDWQTILNPSVIGCFHTHPGNLLRPSQKDHRTCRSWVWSSGRPMVCGIKCPPEHVSFCFYRWSESKVAYQKLNSRLFGPLFIATMDIGPKLVTAISG